MQKLLPGHAFHTQLKALISAGTMTSVIGSTNIVMVSGNAICKISRVNSQRKEGSSLSCADRM